MVKPIIPMPDFSLKDAGYSAIVQKKEEPWILEKPVLKKFPFLPAWRNAPPELKQDWLLKDVTLAGLTGVNDWQYHKKAKHLAMIRNMDFRVNKRRDLAEYEEALDVKIALALQDLQTRDFFRKSQVIAHKNNRRFFKVVNDYREDQADFQTEKAISWREHQNMKDRLDYIDHDAPLVINQIARVKKNFLEPSLEQIKSEIYFMERELQTDSLAGAAHHRLKILALLTNFVENLAFKRTNETAMHDFNRFESIDEKRLLLTFRSKIEAWRKTNYKSWVEQISSLKKLVKTLLATKELNSNAYEIRTLKSHELANHNNFLGMTTKQSFQTITGEIPNDKTKRISAFGILKQKSKFIENDINISHENTKILVDHSIREKSRYRDLPPTSFQKNSNPNASVTHISLEDRLENLENKQRIIRDSKKDENEREIYNEFKKDSQQSLTLAYRDVDKSLTAHEIAAAESYIQRREITSEFLEVALDVADKRNETKVTPLTFDLTKSSIEKSSEKTDQIQLQQKSQLDAQKYEQKLNVESKYKKSG